MCGLLAPSSLLSFSVLYLRRVQDQVSKCAMLCLIVMLYNNRPEEEWFGWFIGHPININMEEEISEGMCGIFVPWKFVFINKMCCLSLWIWWWSLKHILIVFIIFAELIYLYTGWVCKPCACHTVIFAGLHVDVLGSPIHVANELIKCVSD